MVARPPTEPLYRSRRARRPLDHHRRLSSGGGGGRRDQRTPSPSAGDSAGGGATARSGGAAGSGAEAGGRGGGGGGRKEGGKCERAASTTTTAPGGGLDDDVDDDDDDGLSTVGTEGGGTEEEDNRITYVEFKAVCPRNADASRRRILPQRRNSSSPYLTISSSHLVFVQSSMPSQLSSIQKHIRVHIHVGTVCMWGEACVGRKSHPVQVEDVCLNMRRRVHRLYNPRSSSFSSVCRFPEVPAWRRAVLVYALASVRPCTCVRV